jgi:hypothetical protein
MHLESVDQILLGMMLSFKDTNLAEFDVSGQWQTPTPINYQVHTMFSIGPETLYDVRRSTDVVQRNSSQISVSPLKKHPALKNWHAVPEGQQAT